MGCARRGQQPADPRDAHADRSRQGRLRQQDRRQGDGRSREPLGASACRRLEVHLAHRLPQRIGHLRLQGPRGLAWSRRDQLLRVGHRRRGDHPAPPPHHLRLAVNPPHHRQHLPLVQPTRRTGTRRRGAQHRRPPRASAGVAQGVGQHQGQPQPGAPTQGQPARRQRPAAGRHLRAAHRGPDDQGRGRTVRAGALRDHRRVRPAQVHAAAHAGAAGHGSQRPGRCRVRDPRVEQGLRRGRRSHPRPRGERGRRGVPAHDPRRRWTFAGRGRGRGRGKQRGRGPPNPRNRRNRATALVRTTSCCCAVARYSAGGPRRRA